MNLHKVAYGRPLRAHPTLRSELVQISAQLISGTPSVPMCKAEKIVVQCYELIIVDVCYLSLSNLSLILFVSGS